MLDTIIRGGTVHDGSGGEPFQADIGILGDKVAAVGGLHSQQAAEELDAAGLAVAPGFIDVHSHADLHLLHDRHSLPKIRQGVTTEVIGNCGLSLVPVRVDDREALREYLAGVLGSYAVSFQGTTIHEFLDALEHPGIGVNVVPMVAHGAIKRKVMGFDREQPGRGMKEAMERELHAAFDAGCHGLSTGLAYPPAFFSAPGEFIDFTRVVAARGGIFSIHMRSEGNFLLESIDEALAIAEATGVPLEISHLKAYGSKNWHKTELALEKIEKAHQEGMQVSFDSYPYTYGSTTLSALLPPSLFEAGKNIHDLLRNRDSREALVKELTCEKPGTENYAVIAGWGGLIFTGGISGKNSIHEGKSIAAIGEAMATTPEEALISLLLDEGGSASMLISGMDEDSVATIMKHPLHMVGSDGLYGMKPHPRTCGAFVRVLERYVREKKTLTLPEAIGQMTSAPAGRFGLAGRGRIMEGAFADLVIFDPARVHERSTIEEPWQEPEGIDHVFVNGKLAVKKGVPQDILAGRVLRK